jgi:hypothetical protein
VAFVAIATGARTVLTLVGSTSPVCQ